jgi:GntR family transcriptional regulator
MAARPKQDQPAYMRAREAVLSLMRAERLGPGAKVPSERALAAQLGLSRMTVRQGIENLVRAGFLERDGTSGTRVADVSVVRIIDSRRAFSMSEIVKSSGARPGSRLLVFGPQKADRSLAARLDIEPGAPVMRMRRLRTADDIPFCIETSCIPADLVPGLVAEDLAQNASLYSLLRDRYGLVPTDRDSEISAAPINAEDAWLLGLREGINVLHYRSIVRDAQGRVIESVASVNHPQRVVFSTHAPQVRI